MRHLYDLADDPQMDDVLAPMRKSCLENPYRSSELPRRKEAVLKEENAIREKLPNAKHAEKKRLLKQLEDKNAEYAKLTDLMFRTPGPSFAQAVSRA